MADKPVKKGPLKKTDDDIASVAGGISFGDSRQVSGPVVNTSGGAYIGGNVNVGGGTFVGRDQNITVNLDAAPIERTFKAAYEAIKDRKDTSDEVKNDLRAEVKDLESHFHDKGNDPEEGFIARRTRNIGRMAPDIFDVIITTLGNPVAGFALALKKSAEKAKEQASKSS